MNFLSIRVLLLASSRELFERVRALLSSAANFPCEVEWAASSESARSLLGQNRYDAALIEAHATRELAGELRAGAVPFIVLEENEPRETLASETLASERLASETLAGAADHLKPDELSAPLLARSLRYAIELHRAQASLQAAREVAPATVDTLPDGIAVLDARGAVESAIETGTEVSGRQRAEVALHFQKTLLEAQSEASLDGILVVSGECEVLSHNKRLLEMWGLAPDLASRGGYAALAAAVLELVRHPEPFARRVSELYQNHEERSHDEFELLDGRVFERYSAPIFNHEGVYYGRVWYFRDISDRKSVERALRESEARSGAVIQYALDCIITIDGDDRVVEWNPAAQATFGYTREEAVGQILNDLIVPAEFQEAHRNGITHFLASGEGPILNQRVEVPARRKDGSLLTVELAATAIAGSDPPLFTSYLRDITERKESERALRQSDEQFQSIVANVPGMVYQFVVHPDGSLEWPFVSEGCREIYEVEPEWIQSHPTLPSDVIHPEDLPGFDRATRGAAQTVSPWNWEGRLRLTSGKIRWIQAAARPQLLPEGAILWNGLVMDISARKEAEAERDRFFTMSLEMLGILGMDGYFKRLNPAFSENSGYSEAELMATPFMELVHPDDRAATWKSVEDISGGGLVVGFENRYKHKDGSYRWLEWKSAAAADEGLIYAAARDITGRKTSENELRRMRDELEIRVEERTIELERSNLTLQAEIKERERAEAEVRAQARQHEAVADLGRRALLGLDLDTLFDGVVALVSSTLEIDCCLFWEREMGTESLRLRSNVGLGDDADSLGPILIGDQSQIGYASRTGEFALSEDLANETRFVPAAPLSQAGVTSKIVVPVQDGELYGALAAWSPDKPKWNQNEIFFLQTVANVLASAIAHKHAEAEILALNTDLQGANHELRQSEARLLQGNQISTDLMRLRVKTDEELLLALHQITEAASTLMETERSSVWLFNEEGTSIRCADLYEKSARRHSSGPEVSGDPHYFHIINTQQVILADNALTDSATRGLAADYLEPHGIGATLDVALVVGGKRIGVLCSEHVGGSRAWQAEDRTFASAIASVCSLVLESYERTRAEEALHEAKEEAERATTEAQAANRAKSEFLSRMSHELRTPLNAILGFGQILGMRISDPKQRGNVQQILKAGRHLLGLINEVLDIARIEAGHLSLSLEPIAAGIVTQETLDLVKPLAATRGIELINQVMGESADWHLLADQQRLKQVLLNLLSNAVKYNREGGSVWVSTEILAQAPETREGIRYQGRLRFLVRDNGAGLSASDIAKLFMPFERLEAARTQIEGTGIGLTLCKRLVEAMNGHIGVSSQEGVGSTFWVELPLVSSPLQQATIASQNLELAPAEPAPEELGTILYIEDNLSNISLIEHALSTQNYRVKFLTAMQGSVGLELASQHLPDLILLDVHLPDIMGDVVLRQLKTGAATREIPVVVLSADATPSQVDRLLEGGAATYLTKPLDLKQFFEVLEGFLIKD